MREYEKIANQSNSANQSFLDIFRKQKLVTLQVGILSVYDSVKQDARANLVWCLCSVLLQCADIRGAGRRRSDLKDHLHDLHRNIRIPGLIFDDLFHQNSGQ